MSAKKIRVAVLYGGRSAEHEVSLVSATNVIQNLDINRFEIIPIGIDQQGSWFLNEGNLPELGTTIALPQNRQQRLFAPELLNQPTLRDNPEFIQSTQKKERLFDVIFPVIHGTFCEDGTIQGLLELADLPYVGCGVLASAVGMDKDIAKRLVADAGIAIPPYLAVKSGHWQKNRLAFCQAVKDKLNFPVFVKPSNAGSSIGITKVKQPDQLASAIENAFLYDVKVVVEQGINVMELELAVLESMEAGADPIISEVGEIRPSHEYYSYEAKYLDKEGADLLIPAPISDAIRKQAQSAAKTIFQALDCEGMARVDLFLDKDTQQLYFNEINSIPGFTQISMYPKLMASSGISYSQLLTHLIELAIKRHQEKSQLIRSTALA